MEQENLTNLVGSITDDLLKKGKASIDANFGKGYAKEHPELISEYLRVSTNLITTIMLQPQADPYDFDDMDDEDEDDEDLEDLFQN